MLQNIASALRCPMKLNLFYSLICNYIRDLLIVFGDGSESCVTVFVD